MYGFSRLGAVLVLGLMIAAGCVRTGPPAAAPSALYRDLQRLVAVQTAAGWQIDRVEIDELLPNALMSVCQVTPSQRSDLLRWLDGRIAELGGPVEQAYRARGNKLKHVNQLLEVTRIRMTLVKALDSAQADCPFWLDTTETFAGRQISDDRFQLSFGGGGKGILVSQAGNRDINFGGAGRLLLGRNIGSRWGAYLGVEAGGSAGFPRDDDGGGRENLVLAVDLVTPLVMRYRMVNAYVELEAGYLAHLTEQDWSDPSHGFHVGVAFGGRASRVRWFFPGAVFGIAYEQTIEDQARFHALKMGFRVAIDIDF